MTKRTLAEQREYEARCKLWYEKMDACTGEVEMSLHDAKCMRCNVCQYYASPLIGGYAFTRPDPWMLFGCRCPYKYKWVWVLKSGVHKP